MAAAATAIDIVPWLGRKCNALVNGQWVQMIPLSVFVLAGGRQIQPTIWCSNWAATDFGMYPLIKITAIQE